MKRRILIVMGSVLLALGAGFLPVPSMAADPLCGDVNDSETVSSVDALLVLRKSVGQPVALMCSAYDDAINTCQIDLMETNGELLSCEGSLTNVTIQLEQCTSESSCGNGEVDAVGEHCDGDDLDGYDCQDLGYDAGTLACHETCDFDPLRCFECATRGGTAVDGYCWFVGAAGDSCDDVCADAGLVYDVATRDYAGSGAPDASGCVAVHDAIVPAIPPAVPLNTICGGGFSGCAIDVPSDRYARCVSPTTTSGAANANQRRFCACRELILIF